MTIRQLTGTTAALPAAPTAAAGIPRGRLILLAGLVLVLLASLMLAAGVSGAGGHHGGRIVLANGGTGAGGDPGNE